MSELESSMNQVQVEQKNYEMPPRDGFTVAYFLTVADVDRSAHFYERVFGGRILSRGDSNGLPGYVQIANTWLIVNVGGGPTPEKPSITLSVPDPDKISSFMHIEEPSSSLSRRTSTARRSATSAILTVILSRSDRASRASRTVNTRP
jgi:hypothetical protein